MKKDHVRIELSGGLGLLGILLYLSFVNDYIWQYLEIAFIQKNIYKGVLPNGTFLNCFIEPFSVISAGILLTGVLSLFQLIIGVYLWRKNLQRTEVVDPWTSPLYISTYIALLAFVFSAIFTSHESLFGYDWFGGEFISTNEFYLHVGTFIALGIFAIFLFTAGVTFKIYSQTRIREFLIFGLILSTFIVLGIGNVAISLFISLAIGFEFLSYINPFVLFPFLHGGSETIEIIKPMIIDPFTTVGDPFATLWTLLSQFNTVIVHFIFGLYFMRTIWLRSPKRVRIIVSSLAGVNIINIVFVLILFIAFPVENFYQLPRFDILISTTDIQNYVVLIFTLITFPLQILYTYLYLGRKAYQLIDPPNPTPRIISATILWRLLLLIFIIYAICSIIISPSTYLYNQIFFLPYEPIELLFKDFFAHLQFFTLFLALTSFLLLCYIALWVPEGLLIFETHLYRATQAYKQVDEERRLQFSHSLSLKAIEEYLLASMEVVQKYERRPGSVSE